MAYDDDEIRREAARKRLEERMRRSGARDGAARQAGRSQRQERASRASRLRESGQRAERPAQAERSAQAASASSVAPAAQSLFDDKRVRLAAIAVIAIVVIAVLLAAVVVPTCSGKSADDSSSQSSPATSSAASSSADASATAAAVGDASTASVSDTPKQDELNEIIGEEEANKLVEQAKTNDDALWIAAHPDALAFDGPEVQAKVLKLAADDPLALTFVRNFPDQYPSEKPSDDQALALDAGSPSADVPATDVPHLYQWDRRWGYTEYNADAFGLSGCGPTSLAMVYQGLTGKSDRTPYDMGQLAYEGGYVVEWLGTANDFFTESADELGLKCEVLESGADAIVGALESGKPIVANLGVGTFTSYGHFFVLAGLTDDGQIIVNDPYSATRSSQAWDPELIASESVALYAYSA